MLYKPFGMSHLVLGCMLLGGGAYAQTTEERITELERRIQILGAELERERMGDVFLPATESRYGLGPAASKIYAKEQGLSIGGYGEALYQNFEGETPSEADFLRAVLYVGHKFTDRWVLNTEFEFEHASTSEEGSVSVEFAYIDYLWDEAVNFRAGLVLIPMGFINEYHEPTTFYGARRPDIESVIIPSTWRENGAGVFGEVGDFSYKAFVVNGLQGEDFHPDGLRGGRQKGSEALAEDLAGVVRLDWHGVPGLTLGVAGYYGGSGQDLEVSVDAFIAEAHAEWRWRGLSVRGLAVQAELDDVAALNRLVAADREPPVADAEIQSIGETLSGWYIEAGYDMLNEVDAGELAVIPFIRYEAYDTQAEVPDGFASSDRYQADVLTLGLNIKPIDELVFKAEYQMYDRGDDSGINQFNLGMGYIF